MHNVLLKYVNEQLLENLLFLEDIEVFLVLREHII